MKNNLPNRAWTNKEKAEVMARILKVWEANPEQRLGQLIDNAIYDLGPSIFNIEDKVLAEAIEERFKAKPSL